MMMTLLAGCTSLDSWRQRNKQNVIALQTFSRPFVYSLSGQLGQLMESLNCDRHVVDSSPTAESELFEEVG